MTKGVKILIAVVVVVIIAVMALLLMPKNTANESSNTSSNTATEDGQSQTGRQESDVTITYDGSTFKLSATTIKSGGIVKVVNESTKDLQFESDPHPAHTNNPELNAGDIGPGKSALFTLTTKGTWGFHNHLNASQKGELTVQ